MPELPAIPAVSSSLIESFDIVTFAYTNPLQVDGVDLVIGTSSFLREHSHGKDMVAIEKAAIEVINYVKRYALDARVTAFCC